MKKQDTNIFVAFKALYNQELLSAIDSEDVNRIEEILQTTYEYETKEGFYVKTPVDLKKIQEKHEVFVKEIEENPELAVTW